jgi:WG containing repeat
LKFGRYRSLSINRLWLLVILGVPCLLAIVTLTHGWGNKFLPDAGLLKPYMASDIVFDKVPMSERKTHELDTVFAWRSILSSDDGGTLSLNPIDGSLPSLLWEVNQGAAVQIKSLAGLGVALPGTEQLIELRAQSQGLIAAKVRFVSKALAEGQSKNNRPIEVWGYVFPSGAWAILPQYENASDFVGAVGVVSKVERPTMSLPPGSKDQYPIVSPPGSHLQLIGTQGQVLKELGGSRQFSDLDAFELKRHGGWTLLYSGSLQSPGRTQYILTDGERLIENFPGNQAKASPDGSLWIVMAEGGHQVLWSPERGYLETTVNRLWGAPLSGTVYFGVKDAGSREQGLFDLNGRLVMATGIQDAELLGKDRYKYCTNFPQKCGIFTTNGQWWAPSIYERIEAFGPGKVLLQHGKIPCIVDLSLEKQDDCRSSLNGASAAKIFPMLESAQPGQEGLQYGYLHGDGTVAVPFKYSDAKPFHGQLAAVRQGGFPGLIDQAGRWTTPRIEGKLEEKSLLAAHFLPFTSLNSGPIRTSWGVLDRKGSWVVPPVFASISRYADGSLLACAHGQGLPRQLCEHRSVQGQSLPVTNASLLDYKTLEHNSVNQGIKVELAGTPTSVGIQLEAVARNGKWGYKDTSDQWIIEPSFDDAEHFVGQIAIAAKARPRDKQDDKRDPSNKTDEFPALHWGLIDRSGQWITPPQFDSIELVKPNLAITSKDSSFGLIDGSGVPIGEANYTSIQVFRDGVSVATRQDGSSCHLFENGRCVGTEGLVSIARTSDRYSIGQVRRENGAEDFGFLNSAGEWVIQPTLKGAFPFVGEHAVAATARPALPKEFLNTLTTVKLAEAEGTPFYIVSAAKANEKGEIRVGVGLAINTGQWLVPKRMQDLTLQDKLRFLWRKWSMK